MSAGGLGGGEESGSASAEAAEISALFAAKIAGLRRHLSRRDIPAAVQALQQEKLGALRALADRRKRARDGDREIERLRHVGEPT